MEPETFHVVTLSIADPDRRRRVRRILRHFGEAVTLDAFEVPQGGPALRSLRAAIAPELAPGDDVRIYPVCARCRAGVLIYGDGDIARLDVAWIF